jgi:hypothetical protein
MNVNETSNRVVIEMLVTVIEKKNYVSSNLMISDNLKCTSWIRLKSYMRRHSCSK